MKVRKILFTFALFILSGTVLEASAGCRHGDHTFRCVEYLDNYDGDTFKVRIPSVHPLLGEEISIRITGIDAPEIRAEKACERQAAFRAQEALHDLLQRGGEITLKEVNRDKYFRVLAHVEVDGKDIGREMIRQGLAVPYDGGTRPDVNWCHRN